MHTVGGNIYNNMQAMLVIGDIFRNVQPDETDEERRELER